MHLFSSVLSILLFPFSIVELSCVWCIVLWLFDTSLSCLLSIMYCVFIFYFLLCWKARWGHFRFWRRAIQINLISFDFDFWPLSGLIDETEWCKLCRYSCHTCTGAFTLRLLRNNLKTMWCMYHEAGILANRFRQGHLSECPHICVCVCVCLPYSFL